MIIGIEGEEGSAKTTLAYTAPLPIVGFSTDMGTKRAIYGAKYEDYFEGLKIEISRRQKDDKPRESKDWAGNDITVFEVTPPIQLDETKHVGYIETWSYLIQSFYNALQDDEVKTIVMDTMTLVRKIRVDARLQELPGRKQLTQIEYGVPNSSVRNIYTNAAGLEKNMIVIHHLTDEREDVQDNTGKIVQVITGRKILEGLNDTNRYLDVSIRMEKDKRTKTITGTMNKCGNSPMLEGIPLPDPTWNDIVDSISNSTGGRFQFDRRERGGAKWGK